MHKLFHLPCAFLILTAIALLGGSARSHAVEKRIDTIFLPHDPAPGGVIGWAAGSILNLEGKRHLVMLVTANYGGHDDSHAKIFRFDSLDGGLTWTPLEKAVVFHDWPDTWRSSKDGIPEALINPPAFHIVHDQFPRNQANDSGTTGNDHASEARLAP